MTDDLRRLLFRQEDDYFEVWEVTDDLRWLYVSGLTLVGTLRKMAELLEGNTERYVTQLSYEANDDRITIGALTEAVA